MGDDSATRVELSIIMPVHNEGPTLETVLKQLGQVRFPVAWELIIVDDGSTDGATDLIHRDWVGSAESVHVLRSVINRGKGSALRRGFAHASGRILGVQDADLEYDPNDIPRLLGPLLDGDGDAVFGVRNFGAHASFSFWYVMGNRLLSLAAGILFNRYVTDVYTCYKYFLRDKYEQLPLTADGFEIEAELTGGLLRRGTRVFEVPISYAARSREEGKKIRPRDGIRGIARLFRVRVRGY